MQKHISRFLPHLLTIFLFFYSWNLYWGGNRWKGFFLADSNGYYAYLPSTFIYHDLSFSFIDDIQKKDFPSFNNFDFRQQQQTEATNKWYCGTSAAILPFFLLGHALSFINGTQPNGYSFWYAWSLSIAALSYCFIGLYALKKILAHYFNNNLLISIVLIFILFGTNLFYYATSEPAMSHIYSFAIINLFVLSIINLIEKRKSKSIIISAVLLALIILIRPVNGFILFIIPFMIGSKEVFKQIVQFVLSNRKSLFGSIIFIALILSIQLIFYKLELGRWLIYSYGIERMNFLNPHLLDFLFSYKKGLFVYLPLALLSLTGFLFIYKSNRWQFYSLFIFTILLCYVFSCWWNWWYGGSFGTRPMVEYLFIFSILLGYTLNNLTHFVKKLYVTLCILCIILCQVQTYQYRYYFIHWDKMDKESYWKVFMRVDLLIKNQNPNKDRIK